MYQTLFYSDDIPDLSNELNKASVYLDTADLKANVSEILQGLRKPLNLIQSTSQPDVTDNNPNTYRSQLRHSVSSVIGLVRADSDADVVVELREKESASAFHDFLYWAYPQSV